MSTRKPLADRGDRDDLARRQRYRVDLREMMTQCEANYGYLMRLLRLLGEQDQVQLSLPHGEVPRTLVLRVLERCRYTTMLELEQETLHSLLPGPAFTVRLYHDARSAEVTAARPYRQTVPARHDYPNAAMHQRDEKLQWNRFLSEWLRHLQEHGGLAGAQWKPQVSGA